MTAPTPITTPKTYTCPACGKKLVIGVFSGWVEVSCKWCKRNRRIAA